MKSDLPSDRREPNRTLYDRINRAYDLLCSSSERPARQKALDLLDPKDGEHILEVGCGTGSDLLDIARRVGPTGRAVGVDLSRGMLEVARGKLASALVGARVALAEGDARQLPFADRVFDGAYTSFTLEIFSKRDLAMVLREIRRVLRPGGRMGLVSVGTGETGGIGRIVRRTYLWFHRHFPHLIDCRPIEVGRVLDKGRFEVSRKSESDIWGIPVTAAVARKMAS